MSALTVVLQRTAGWLKPHRDALVEAWIRSLAAASPAPPEVIQAYCGRNVDALLSRLAKGEIEELLKDEAAAAAAAAQAGPSFHPLALAIRVFDRCCLPFLLGVCPDRDALADALLALDELGCRRLEVLLAAQEEEAQRRLVEAEEQAARADEKARDLARANESLRRAQAESQHRADAIALLHDVARRIAAVLEPERLMQEAADAIRGKMSHTYVAVVVLDDEGVLVGRWAGRPGVGRRSAGRAQGPAGGVIGRALRKRSPQVVGDVTADPDYHADVAGTRSEMVIPLLEDGVALGAIDFQSERPDAFNLDDAAAGEALADFLIVALRNARLFAEARGSAGPKTPA